MICVGCGEPMVGRRPQAKYHDDACRARHKRAEHDRTSGAFWRALSQIKPLRAHPRSQAVRRKRKPVRRAKEKT